MSPPTPMQFCPECRATFAEPGFTFCPQDGAALQSMSQRGSAEIGKVLAGRYKIERFVGAGGFAEVFGARVMDTDRRVAVKLLSPELAATPDGAARFRQEAELISLVAHPNVVAIQDYGTLSDGRPFMVMELLHGASLSEHLEGSPIAPLLAFRIAMQMCEGLAAAHERGVVHRDIKPDNVFLVGDASTDEFQVKILDLGIARLFGDSAPRKRLTQRGMLFGTPEYMAPEQVTGLEVGPPADVYAVACVLWEMLLGAPPFVDPSFVTVLTRQAHAPPVWPLDAARLHHVPEEAQSLLLRTLAKDPRDRPSSMLELQGEIATLAGRLRLAARNSKPAQALADTSPAPGNQVLADTSRPPGSENPTLRESRVPQPLRCVPLAESNGSSSQIVEVASGVHWVGQRRALVLECNPYLRIFRGQGKEISLLIDPGAPKDLDIVEAKVSSLIGSFDQLDFVFLNHQDPDVSSSTPAILGPRSRARLLCSEDTWRLVQFYEIDSGRVMATDALPGEELELETGHRVVMVPTPFCHFRGAVMLYDPESRVLFSGDLFGGASAAPGLVADEDCWPGIEMFHQVYMPTNRALRRAVARVRELTPPPLIIAPQHGALLVGELVGWVLDRVERLAVGLDLLETADDGVASARHVAVANEILDALALVAGGDRVSELVGRYAADGSFANPFVVKEAREIVGFRVNPQLGLEALERDAIAFAPEESRNVMERVVRRALGRHGLWPARPTTRRPVNRA